MANTTSNNSDSKKVLTLDLLAQFFYVFDDAGVTTASTGASVILHKDSA